jgi:hypothetical protein
MSDFVSSANDCRCTSEHKQVFSCHLKLTEREHGELVVCDGVGARKYYKVCEHLYCNDAAMGNVLKETHNKLRGSNKIIPKVNIC